jgi:hypothetical protein
MHTPSLQCPTSLPCLLNTCCPLPSIHLTTKSHPPSALTPVHLHSPRQTPKFWMGHTIERGQGTCIIYYARSECPGMASHTEFTEQKDQICLIPICTGISRLSPLQQSQAPRKVSIECKQTSTGHWNPKIPSLTGYRPADRG